MSSNHSRTTHHHQQPTSDLLQIKGLNQAECSLTYLRLFTTSTSGLSFGASTNHQTHHSLDHPSIPHSLIILHHSSISLSLFHLLSLNLISNTSQIPSLVPLTILQPPLSQTLHRRLSSKSKNSSTLSLSLSIHFLSWPSLDVESLKASYDCNWASNPIPHHLFQHATLATIRPPHTAPRAWSCSRSSGSSHPLTLLTFVSSPSLTDKALETYRSRVLPCALMIGNRGQTYLTWSLYNHFGDWPFDSILSLSKIFINSNWLYSSCLNPSLGCREFSEPCRETRCNPSSYPSKGSHLNADPSTLPSFTSHFRNQLSCFRPQNTLHPRSRTLNWPSTSIPPISGNGSFTPPLGSPFLEPSPELNPSRGLSLVFRTLKLSFQKSVLPADTHFPTSVLLSSLSPHTYVLSLAIIFFFLFLKCPSMYSHPSLKLVMYHFGFHDCVISPNVSYSACKLIYTFYLWLICSPLLTSTLFIFCLMNWPILGCVFFFFSPIHRR